MEEKQFEGMRTNLDQFLSKDFSNDVESFLQKIEAADQQIQELLSDARQSLDTLSANTTCDPQTKPLLDISDSTTATLPAISTSQESQGPIETPALDLPKSPVAQPPAIETKPPVAKKAAGKHTTDYKAWEKFDPDAEEPSIADKSASELKEREKRKQESEKIKNLGNEAFRTGDYATAIKRYGEAIDLCSETVALWTNRAQAFLKLTMFKEALSDCEQALILDDSNLKARMRKGTALMGLERFEEAEKELEAVLAKDPKSTEVQEQLKKCRKLAEEHRSLQAISGDSESPAVLEGVADLATLKSQLSNFISLSPSQISDLRAKIDALSRALVTASDPEKSSLLSVQIRALGLIQLLCSALVLAQYSHENLVSSILKILKLICEDNDFNKEEISRSLKWADITGSIQDSSRWKQTTTIQEFFKMLVTICSNESARNLLANQNAILDIFTAALQYSSVNPLLLEVVCLLSKSSLFGDLLVKNSDQSQKILEFVFSQFGKSAHENQACSALLALSGSSSLAKNILCKEEYVIKMMKFFKNSVELHKDAKSSRIEVSSELLAECILSVLVNLSMHSDTPQLDSDSRATLVCSLRSSTDFLYRIFAILEKLKIEKDRDGDSLVLRSVALVAQLCVWNSPVPTEGVAHLTIREEVLSSGAISLLSHALKGTTSKSDEVRTQVLQECIMKAMLGCGERAFRHLPSDRALKSVVSLLCSSIPSVAGNAALWIGEVAQNNVEAAEKFGKFGALDSLITIMRHGQAQAQKNAAITAARLCKYGPNLEYVRTAGGLENMYYLAKQIQKK